jgi:hypothetical protein
MKKTPWNYSRWLLGAATGSAMLLFAAAAVAPATAQPANAADLCTPDVFRLCSTFIPDRGPITACLRKKLRQLSPGCRSVMSPKRKK